MRWTLHTDKERDAVCEHIRRVKIEQGKPYEVTCQRKTKRRTLPLNSTYWLWLTAIANETGNDKDALHRCFSNRYLPKRIELVFGKEQEKPWSTTELDTKAFTEYMELIQRDMAEYGIQLEWPSSPLFDQFFEHYRGKVG
jgi:hypothetical protein